MAQDWATNLFYCVEKAKHSKNEFNYETSNTLLMLECIFSSIFLGRVNSTF